MTLLLSCCVWLSFIVILLYIRQPEREGFIVLIRLSKQNLLNHLKSPRLRWEYWCEAREAVIGRVKTRGRRSQGVEELKKILRLWIVPEERSFRPKKQEGPWFRWESEAWRLRRCIVRRAFLSLAVLFLWVSFLQFRRQVPLRRPQL
jgi:hypothetical protein